jgi:hypothetical protein
MMAMYWVRDSRGCRDIRRLISNSVNLFVRRLAHVCTYLSQVSPKIIQIRSTGVLFHPITERAVWMHTKRRKHPLEECYTAPFEIGPHVVA